MISIRSSVLAIATLVLLCPPPALSSERLAQLRKLYRDALTKIEDEAAVSRVSLNKQYGDLLKRKEKEFMSEGVLETTDALRSERKRFDVEKSVPATSETAARAEVVALHKLYRGAEARIDESRRKKSGRLAGSYARQLESLQVALTREDKLSDARAVKTEIDFLVASEEYETPAENGGAGERTGAKILKTTKAIPARGGLNGGWTRVPMSLKAGDIVTVRASGSWTCPRQTTPYGPKGRAVRNYSRAYPPQIATANYGALLMKVGSRGLPQAVGHRLVFTNSVPGIMAFDINLKQDLKARQLSSGRMTVDIRVIRPVE